MYLPYDGGDFVAKVCNCCRECGALFIAPIPLVYCPQHKYLDDQQFSIVEDYVIKHPLCNAIEVNAGTSVGLLELLRYINEGRLYVVDEKISIKKD